MAVLIDCHSMPSVSTCPPGRESERRVKADFVLGDRYGTSCAGDLIDLVDHELRRMGYTIFVTSLMLAVSSPSITATR